MSKQSDIRKYLKKDSADKLKRIQKDIVKRVKVKSSRVRNDFWSIKIFFPDEFNGNILDGVTIDHDVINYAALKVVREGNRKVMRGIVQFRKFVNFVEAGASFELECDLVAIIDASNALKYFLAAIDFEILEDVREFGVLNLIEKIEDEDGNKRELIVI